MLLWCRINTVSIIYLFAVVSDIFILDSLLRGGKKMFGLIGNFGPWELGFILIIVLIIFGPGKLPQLGESVGKAVKGFRKAQDEDIEKLEK